MFENSANSLLDYLSPETSAALGTSRLYTRWLNVTVSHLEESEFTRLTFTLTLTLDNGTTQHSSKSVRVTDAVLQERLRYEVKPGDSIRVCLETDWAADDIPTVLKNFCLP